MDAPSGIPQHVAIIMDGNGRWAAERGQPRAFGHRAGAKAVREIVRAAGKRGVRHLSVFAFSSENWRRPKDEISALMSLFLRMLRNEVKALERGGVRLRFFGDRTGFGAQLEEEMRRAEVQTAHCDQLTFNIAIGYGGRWDILQATQKVAAACARGECTAEQITEEDLAKHLCLADQPPPDLLIRTSGELRLSNFLLWQLAYTEFYFADCHWPDFNPEQLDRAIAAFAARERRFGKTSQQLSEPPNNA